MFSNFKKYLISSSLFLVFIVIFYYYHKNRRLKILDSPIYTTSIITELSKKAKSSDYYRYKYTYKNISYIKGIGETSSKNLFVGKRYFVIFEESDPDNSMLIPFLFVPDSITKAPDEGWIQPPIPIDKNEIKKFLENY